MDARPENPISQAIFDASSDGIIAIDLDGRIDTVNNAAGKMLCIDDIASYIGKNIVELLMGAAYDLPGLLRVLSTDPQHITRRRFECPVSDGRSVFVEEIGSPILDGRDHLIGRLLTLRDISEEKRRLADWEEITQSLIHDIRGPLAVITNTLLLVQEIMGDPDPLAQMDDINELLKVSLESGQELMKRVDNYSHIIGPKPTESSLRLTEMTVATLVQSACAALASVLEQANINLELDVPDSLPPVLVDGELIRHALVHLLENAGRHTPEGGKIHISARVLQDRVLLHIADSGPGFPPDEISHVFKKFWRSRNKPLRGSKGSGLGLALCQLILEAHGETIWLEEKSPLPGACFALTLPPLEKLK